MADVERELASIQLPDGSELSVKPLLEMPHDLSGLIEAMEKQPANYATVCMVVAQVKRVAADADITNDVKRANAAHLARITLEKPTEAAIKEAVDRDDGLVKERRKRADLEQVLNMLEGIKRALEHKKDMLVSSVTARRIEADSDMVALQRKVQESVRR